MVAYCLQKVLFRMKLELRNIGFKNEEENILAKNHLSGVKSVQLRSADGDQEKYSG